MRVLLQAMGASGARPLRYLLGAAIVLGGGYLLLGKLEAALLREPQLLRALQSGLLCALGTALGALPVLLLRRMPVRFADGVMGGGVGVMLAATCFSLILPGLDAFRGLGHGGVGSVLLVGAAMCIGALGLLISGRLLPRTSASLSEADRRPLAPQVLLFVFAMVLYNVPEGMAIGVSTGTSSGVADTLTLGIALQNVPEGLIIALVLATAGLSRFRSVLLGAASGLVEPFFAVLCAWLPGWAALLLPWGLALSAGAMLFVITHEIIPEVRRKGNGAFAGTGMAIGFCVTASLGLLLG